MTVHCGIHQGGPWLSDPQGPPVARSDRSREVSDALHAHAVIAIWEELTAVSAAHSSQFVIMSLSALGSRAVLLG